MKKKLVKTIIILTAALTFTACGKKGGSISENLINDDPTAIDMTGALTEPMGDTDTTDYSEIDEGESVTGLYTSVAQDGETASENTISDNAVSDNLIGAEPVSDNALPQTEGDLTEGDLTAGDEMPAAPVYNEQHNDKMIFVNTTGMKLTHIYVTLSTGTMTEFDILNTENLSDGSEFVYSMTDKSALYSATDLSISVKASGKNGDEIDFGTVRIYDPDKMTIVLTGSDKNGYSMYMGQ